MRRNWLVSLALLLALWGLLGSIDDGALWDPHEVWAAELSRRIGLNLLGGGDLSVPGADNSVPIRADLGRGELPFTSIALGFRLFGLSEWAGRLPLALWGLSGIAALYSALLRLADRRTALYAALALATTPLYFLQARVLLGDAVTLASFALAWSGLMAAVFAPDLSPRAQVTFGVLGVLGLYAGFWCRGPIVSVAVPALSVGLTACFVTPSSRARRSSAWAVLGLGLVALAVGSFGVVLARKTGDYSVFVGSALGAASDFVTFDVGLGRLLHAAFPWSALSPLALALVGTARERPQPLQASLLAASLALGFCMAAGSWLGLPWAISALPAIACFAALMGLALAEVEEVRLGGPLLGLSVAALSLLVGLDLRRYPDRALSALGLLEVSLPEVLHAGSGRLWAGGGACLGIVAALCLFEPSADRARAPAFRRAEYGAVLDTLQRSWRGNVVFAALLAEAALVGFLLLVAVSERVVRLPQLDTFGSLSRTVAAALAVLVPLAALLPLATLALRDVARVVFRPGAWHSITRAQGVLLAAAAIGGVASLGLYPAFCRQVAPKQWIDRYRELGQLGERLGMLGSESAAVRYRGARDAVSFRDRDSALQWLTSESQLRRWLLMRRSDLAELNAAFRARRGDNLPILDARSSELLLASNLRRSGELDENPFASIVLSRAPRPDHALTAKLGRELELIGWSLRSPSGEPERFLVSGRASRLVIYYRVLEPVQGAWQAFVHVDGLQRRYNADHELLDGKYPLRLWRPGDIIVDSTELKLERYFSPGAYRLYFGLFAGERRFPVTHGPASEDRIEAGTLHVR